MAENTCPECGHVVNNERTCPNCGCPLVSPLSTKTILKEFNETKPYSPISSTSWLFSTPFPLNRYPRGQFAIKHPDLGWLFGPIHIAYNGNPKDREAYDVLNNFFLLWNLIAKLGLYTFLWFLAKLKFILLITIILVVICFSDYDKEFSGILLLLIFLLASIPFSISAGCASYHRYFPAILKTYRRIRKRHWISMYKAAKYNNLNLD